MNSFYIVDRNYTPMQQSHRSGRSSAGDEALASQGSPPHPVVVAVAMAMAMAMIPSNQRQPTVPSP
jgi:hypothetical protein